MKIRYTALFKREYKKLLKKHYDEDKFKAVLVDLLEYNSATLVRKYKDHTLKGEWKGYRELHVSSDWLLIYIIEDSEVTLTLVQTGSHDDLF